MGIAPDELVTRARERSGLADFGSDEQLFTAQGTAVDFRGGGLRIHRKGGARSDYSDWYGHCWQSAVFPRGRAFGYIHRGDVSIAAETSLSTFNPMIPIREGVAFPPTQQGIAHYRWDDEAAYGMIERSIRADLPTDLSSVSSA